MNLLAFTLQEMRDEFEIFENKSTLLGLAVPLAFEQRLASEDLILEAIERGSMLNQPIKQIPIELFNLQLSKHFNHLQCLSVFRKSQSVQIGSKGTYKVVEDGHLSIRGEGKVDSLFDVADSSPFGKHGHEVP